MPVVRSNAKTGQKFFKAPQGAAVLKHEIQRIYLPIFATKTSTYASDRQVIFLDGYAGRGTYEDGTPASPAIAIEAARKLSEMQPPRDLRCIFVEPDKDLLTPLESLVAGSPHTVMEGTIEDRLDEALKTAENLPLLAFLDPYGLGMRLDRVADRLLNRFRGVGRATEVLLNFNLTGLPRIAGLLTSTKAGEGGQTTLRRMDATMGGPAWRDLWDPDDTQTSASKIVELYCDTARLATGGTFGYHTVSVSDRWNGPAQYELILLTSHRDGLWYFGEAISGAVEKFYAWCNPSQQTMDDPTLRGQEWTDDIAANLETLLREEGTFNIIQHVDRVYGNTLGLARGKHVRAAVKRLHKEGKTLTTGVGPRPEDLVMRPPIAGA